MSEKPLVCVGKVVKVHGVRGELKLFSFSGDSAGLCGYEELYLADGQQVVVAEEEAKTAVGKSFMAGWFCIKRCRPQGKYTLVALEGVASREAAEALVGLMVHVDENALAPLTEDEYYWHQLQGNAVVTSGGENIGTVSSLFSNGVHDVLVVKNKGREFYIPATKEFITGIDPIGKKVTVALIPGLLEMNG